MVVVDIVAQIFYIAKKLHNDIDSSREDKACTEYTILASSGILSLNNINIVICIFVIAQVLYMVKKLHSNNITILSLKSYRIPFISQL